MDQEVLAEYEEFIQDCKELFGLKGFTVLNHQPERQRGLADYILATYEDCTKVIFGFCISDHYVRPNWMFLDENKEFLSKCLPDCDLDSIRLREDKVVVGSVRDDTWDGAFQRLQNKLNLCQSIGRISQRSEV